MIPSSCCCICCWSNCSCCLRCNVPYWPMNEPSSSNRPAVFFRQKRKEKIPWKCYVRKSFFIYKTWGANWAINVFEVVVRGEPSQVLFLQSYIAFLCFLLSLYCKMTYRIKCLSSRIFSISLWIVFRVHGIIKGLHCKEKKLVYKRPNSPTVPPA